MRSYTVKEVDDLRHVVSNKYLWGDYRGPYYVGINGSRSYKEADMVKYVEEHIRTHMIAGHTAQDLIESETTHE